MSSRFPAAGSPVQNSGPAIFALGFRPFFLLAGGFAVFAIPFWLLVFWGRVSLGNTMPGIFWHGHEMVFGFAAAVIAGFLLTAVRNWTGRKTPTGLGLAALAGLWLAGRVVMAGAVPEWLRAVIDLAFLPALAVSIAIPIVKAGNTRNLGIVGLLAALTIANGIFHAGVISMSAATAWSAAFQAAALPAIRFAIDLVILIILVIGGRVIPNFTAGAIADVRIGGSRVVDALAFGSTAAMAVSEAALGAGMVSGVLALAATALNAYRLWGWQGWKTSGRPILWILHVGYAWIPLGLALRGAAAVLDWNVGTAPLHALTVGAISALILGMMTRVSLGHTGRPLQVSPAIAAAYGLVVLAAVSRSVMTVAAPAFYMEWVLASGAAWTLAFGLFVWVYLPILTGPRIDGKPG